MRPSAVAAQYSRSRGTADGLAAAEHDQIGAGIDEAAQILRGRQLRRGIDQHREIRGMSGAHDLLERRTRIRPGEVQDAGGAIADGGADLPRLGIAHTAGGRSVGKADLDQAPARRPHAVIVGVAMALRHDELVAHPVGIGEPRHFRGIESGDAGGRAEQQSCHRAGGYDSRFGARALRDEIARVALQIGDVDAALRRLRHGRDHLRRRADSAEARNGSRGVDHACEAQLRGYVSHLVLISH